MLLLPTKSTVLDGAHASGISAYHVSGKWRVCGKDGELSLISHVENISAAYSANNVSDDMIRENSQFTCLVWHNDYLISGDDRGTVVVWHADLVDGTLTPICNFIKENDAVRAIVVRTFNAPDYIEDDRPLWFAAAFTKLIVVGNTQNNFVRAANFTSPIVALGYAVDDDSIVTINQNPVKQTTELAHHRFESDLLGTLKEVTKAKLDGMADTRALLSVLEGGHIATAAAGSSSITVWDLSDLASKTLTMPDHATVLSMAHHPDHHVFTAFCADGYLYGWQSFPSDTDPWKPLTPLSLTQSRQTDARVTPIQANLLPSLAVWAGREVMYIDIAPALASAAPGIVAAQVGPLTIQVDLSIGQGTSHRIILPTPPNSLHVTSSTRDVPAMLMAATTEAVHVYSIAAPGSRAVTTIKSSAVGGPIAAIAVPPVMDDARIIFIGSGTTLARVLVSGAVVRDSIDLPVAGADDIVQHIGVSLNGRFIAACMESGLISVIDITRASRMTLHQQTVYVPPGEYDFHVKSLAVSADGLAVGLIVTQTLDVRPEASPIVVVCRTDSGLIDSIDLDTHTALPVSIVWDATSPRLFAVLAVRGEEEAEDEDQEAPETPNQTLPADTAVMVLYHNIADSTIVVHEVRPIVGAEALIEVRAPTFTVTAAVPNGRIGQTLVLNDFDGTGTDLSAKRVAGMLDFSYELACGRTDRAFELVRGLPGGALWRNLAVLCVKNRELPMALQCLAQAGDLLAARLGEYQASPEDQLTTLAIHLGIGDDFGLVDAAGKPRAPEVLAEHYITYHMWPEALELARQHGLVAPIVWYRYGHVLEAAGDLQGAAFAFNKARVTHEIPRMLIDRGKAADLTSYTKEIGPQWLGRYYEAKGRAREAFELYKAEGDTTNAARFRAAVFMDRLAARPETVDTIARELTALSSSVERIADRHAHQPVAKALEAAAALSTQPNQLLERAAVHYSSAGLPAHAVRLAIDMDDPALVTRFAAAAVGRLTGSQRSRVMLRAVRYLQTQGKSASVVRVLLNGGRPGDALRLCLAHPEDEEMSRLAPRIIEAFDPSDLPTEERLQVANALMGPAPDAALRLMIGANDTEGALELCRRPEAIMTPDIAAKLMPPPPPRGADMATRRAHKAASQEVAKFIGDKFISQGDASEASAYYQKADEKELAVRALLGKRVEDHAGRLRHVKVLVNFTTSTKQPEMMIMAANEMKRQRWEAVDEDHGAYLAAVSAAVISLYAKARALDQLAAFVAERAISEIDSNRDYDSALDTLNSGLKQLRAAAKRTPSAGRLVERVEKQQETVEAFIGARALAESDEPTFQATCQALLSRDTVEPVKKGDLHALLIEFTVKKAQTSGSAADWTDALHFVRTMMADGDIVMRYYLTEDVVALIWREAGCSDPVPLHLFDEEGVLSDGDDVEDIMSDED